VFAGVWARRSEAAHELANAHSVAAFTDLDALFDACDGVTFSVPPGVQADLAARAARAGKAVCSTSPSGSMSVTPSGRGDDEAASSQVIFTNRYYDSMRAFLDTARQFDSYGGRASFFGNGCVPGSYFATPWRLEHGALLDLGPHVLDALDAALGPIVDISARGDVNKIAFLECAHEQGRISQAALCATTNQDGGLCVEVHGLDGRHRFDAGALDPDQLRVEMRTASHRIVAEFVECIRNGRHTSSTYRGSRCNGSSTSRPHNSSPPERRRRPPAVDQTTAERRRSFRRRCALQERLFPRAQTRVRLAIGAHPFTPPIRQEPERQEDGEVVEANCPVAGIGMNGWAGAPQEIPPDPAHIARFLPEVVTEGADPSGRLDPSGGDDARVPLRKVGQLVGVHVVVDEPTLLGGRGHQSSPSSSPTASPSRARS
jgi:predicted dehydrogenase